VEGGCRARWCRERQGSDHGHKPSGGAHQFALLALDLVRRYTGRDTGFNLYFSGVLPAS
jgi:hypothetical protein